MVMPTMINKKSTKKPIYTTRPIVPDLSDYIKKLETIWNNKWFTNMGDMHKELEEVLQKKLQVNNLSLFNNGTIALITACRALRLSGEVITTPFSFAATPHVLTWNNIKPIFCDIDPDTYNLNPELIEDLITSDTTGIMPVHVFGMPCECLKIQQIADDYGLKVIYDAAHSFGVKYLEKGIGNYGDCSMFSFHATKMFHTAEGGALTCNDKKLKKRLDLLKNFGIKDEDHVSMPGINGKLNELSAALGLVVLSMYNKEREKRKQLFAQYFKWLENIDGIKLPYHLNSNNHNYQYFPIQIDKQDFGVSRNFVKLKFEEQNIFARKYFYPLCSNYSCYQQLESAKIENLPIANKTSQEILCLPLYGDLKMSEVSMICQTILGIKKN